MPRGPRSPTCLPLVRLWRARSPGGSYSTRAGRPGRAVGFTLVEVLVALAVLSIGLMGAAGLSLASYRAQQEALHEHLALIAAEGLAGRIRANAAGLADYAGAPGDLPCAPGPSPVTACTPAELAARDLQDWQALLAGQLPDATGEVLALAGPPAAARVRIAWRARDGVRFIEAMVTP